MINSSESQEVEPTKEFNTRQMIHMIVDELNSLQTRVSRIEDILVQTNKEM